MKKILLLGAVAALVLTASLVAAPDQQVLKGEYFWTYDNTRGDLKATLTPTGENTWDIAFDFRFSGEPHTYKGTATGSLDNGSLAGTVKNENGRRTFTFEGSFDDGRFEGTHAELRKGKERSMGTLWLAR
ncbi:MAG: hypothetical protein AAF481_07740 [Acidobacteriota bacterium]